MVRQRKTGRGDLNGYSNEQAENRSRGRAVRHYATTQLKLPKGTQDHVSIVTAIGRDGTHKLRVADDGSIECVGGEPYGEWVAALHHPPVTSAVRAYLAERQRVEVLVAASLG